MATTSTRPAVEEEESVQAWLGLIVFALLVASGIAAYIGLAARIDDMLVAAMAHLRA